MQQMEHQHVNALQVATLGYLEGLATDSGVCNLLIASSVAPLAVRMLRDAKLAGLQTALASLLGLLLRHATRIAGPLPSSGT